MTSMAEVAGRNARDLRQDAGATLEDLASAARSYGLRWSTGSVGSFESGRTVGVNLENLLAVASALGDVIGRKITLAELFTGEGDVELTEGLPLPLAELRAALSGVAVGVPVVRVAGADVAALGVARRSFPVYDAFRETDVRICKSLGVSPEVGASAMARLWKKTFVAERDRLAGPDANAQRRGRISRQLKAELKAKLEKELSRGNN
jgi:transcriptional regulator with XRE-family HTH domain